MNGDSLKRYRNWAMGLSAGVALLGLALILWPETSALTVCWLLGALCVALGVCQIARYCRLGAAGVLFRFDLGGGILGVLAGLLLLLHPMGALMILPVIAGFYILVEGVFSLQAAVELRRFGLPRWGFPLGLGVLDLLLGFLLILDPFEGAAALMVYLGIALLVTGVSSIYTVACAARAFQSDGHRRIIDAEWRDADD